MIILNNKEKEFIELLDNIWLVSSEKKFIKDLANYVKENKIGEWKKYIYLKINLKNKYDFILLV